MIKFLLRFFGLVIFAVAFIALIADGINSLAMNALVMTPLAQSWGSFEPQSLASFEKLAKSTPYPYIWDPVTVTLLQAPTFAVLGGIGLLFLILGSRRGRPASTTYVR
jgi:hypothetical protein